MKIGLIGSCGYLGSALLSAIGEKFSSARIVAVDDLSTGSEHALVGLDSKLRVRFLQADLATLDLRAELADADVIISLLPPNEQGGKFPAIEVLAQFVALRGIPLLHLSSTAVYGASSSVADSGRLDHLKPVTLAGRRSLAVEARLRELGADDKLHYATLRMAPLVGWSPAVHFRQEPLSWLWSAICNEMPRVTPGILENLRPYLTVEDACLAVLKILEQERFDREPWNIYSSLSRGDQFFSILRSQLPALAFTQVADEGPTLHTLSTLELSRKKLERVGVELSGSPIEAYRKLVERFEAVLPKPVLRVAEEMP